MFSLGTNAFAVAVAFTVALSTGIPARAQLITASDQPAEFPPSSYDGRQYVDSAGCVFVRAGFDGAVTWVPRVTRSRTKLCGFTPTGVRRAEAPVIADTPTYSVARDAAPAPRPRGVVRQRPARVLAAPLVRDAGDRGIAAGNTPAVQAAPVRVPKGYRKVWKDDRLNSNRGKQLLSGALQTALIWTQTVPRRLIDRRNGADVTAQNNYLIYPYTDYAKQKRDLAGGQHVVVRVGSGQRMIVHQSRVGVSQRTGKTILNPPARATYSTKSVRAPGKAVTGRYVQVGSFGVAGNAQATVARLQRTGLPVRIGTVKRDGKVLQIVVAGPFADAQQVQNGLATARRAGFGDAFIRD